jgi:hypothetical protein
MKSHYPVILLALLVAGCTGNPSKQAVKPELRVSEDSRYLVNQAGEPFFWVGGTAWGMSEWLNREDIDFYLDDRAAKGFNLVQVCLFWGKREEDPVRFTTNPANAYGHKAFVEVGGKPDPGQPWVIPGGTPQNPNDYWDHADYIMLSASERNMIVALLPVWGRRYVNATHPHHSEQLFSASAMKSYGRFLGERYRSFSNIIWVLGGDVQADAGGQYLDQYRSMAEGIVTGITGEIVRWNEDSPWWEFALMTYHPDGSHLKNSSRWFHDDPWLDFNMIETHRHRDMVYQAVRSDYELSDPVKPTVMGEPDYEGIPTGERLMVKGMARCGAPITTGKPCWTWREPGQWRLSNHSALTIPGPAGHLFRIFLNQTRVKENTGKLRFLPKSTVRAWCISRTAVLQN